MQALLNGHTLVLIPNEVLFDSESFYEMVNRFKVTHIGMTPSLVAQFDLSLIKQIRRIELGGEMLPVSTHQLLRRTCPEIPVFNVYGPTEASIGSHVGDVSKRGIKIGRPIANVTSYVVNSSLKPVPIGCIGELYIGGIGLARGFAKNELATNLAFIQSPFQSNQRLYKTGDLVKLNWDGELEYIGRKDGQVKLRGHRIELSEIETVINSFECVHQSAVILYDNQLVAYYVPQMLHREVSESMILEFIKNLLPDFMLPNLLIQIPALPLTVNGKLNKAALPEPINLKRCEYIFIMLGLELHWNLKSKVYGPLYLESQKLR